MKSKKLESIKILTMISTISGVLFIVLGLLGMAVKFPNYSMVIIIGLFLLGIFALPLTMLYRYHESKKVNHIINSYKEKPLRPFEKNDNIPPKQKVQLKTRK